VSTPPALPPPSPPALPDPRELRWKLVRDLVVFTIKVALEALRDIVMIPLALVGGAVGLVLHPNEPDRFFREVLRLGDRFDRFVDLFGAEARGRDEAGEGRVGELPQIDELLAPVEELLREQHRKGGVTASAKEAIDKGLDAVQRALVKVRRG
jgi:hypothetical protein